MQSWSSGPSVLLGGSRLQVGDSGFFILPILPGGAWKYSDAARNRHGHRSCFRGAG
jgi:hypothetical protein